MLRRTAEPIRSEGACEDGRKDGWAHRSFREEPSDDALGMTRLTAKLTENPMMSSAPRRARTPPQTRGLPLAAPPQASDNVNSLQMMALCLHVALLAHGTPAIPVIDVSPLMARDSSDDARQCVIDAIGTACQDVGFFQVVGHSIRSELQTDLHDCARQFFALPRSTKREIEMANAGLRWRGYFEVGEEVTSGVVDEKEGLYFAAERPESDTRPLHGPNLFPPDEVAPGLRTAVLDYMDANAELARVLLGAIGASIGLPSDETFARDFAEPTTLFRIFHYPPHEARWGDDTFAVGEHTDYGFITLLRQDDSGGLQAQLGSGEWVEVPPVPGAIVVNLGDALEFCTGGLLRATPHRVQQRRDANAGRFSFAYFYDPTFDAELRSRVHLLPPALRARADERRASAPGRWDGQRLDAFRGTYADYLIGKVSKVFPELSKKTGVAQR